MSPSGLMCWATVLAQYSIQMTGRNCVDGSELSCLFSTMEPWSEISQYIPTFPAEDTAATTYVTSFALNLVVISVCLNPLRRSLPLQVGVCVFHDALHLDDAARMQPRRRRDGPHGAAPDDARCTDLPGSFLPV